ncbi:hypothetical protein C8R43DRAFT_1135346 [Mycena crocata]|nr:hypothetical protein C8R43DRAFT_1135346 [Mycena crocata]
MSSTQPTQDNHDDLRTAPIDPDPVYSRVIAMDGEFVLKKKRGLQAGELQTGEPYHYIEYTVLEEKPVPLIVSYDIACQLALNHEAEQLPSTAAAQTPAETGSPMVNIDHNGDADWDDLPELLPVENSDDEN